MKTVKTLSFSDFCPIPLHLVFRYLIQEVLQNQILGTVLWSELFLGKFISKSKILLNHNWSTNPWIT